MSNNNFQKEILLACNSSFLSRIYIAKCNPELPGLFMEAEKIAEACWNGLLEEVLPGISVSDSSNHQMFIWEIREYDSVMEIDMCEIPSVKDEFMCIDPYKFMRIQKNDLFN